MLDTVAPPSLVRSDPREVDAPHLLHVFPSFAVGGAQMRFTTLARALGQEFRHTVVALRDDYKAATLLSEDAPVSFATPPAASLPWAVQMQGFRHLLKRLKPDLLVTYNWGSIDVALANLGEVPHLHQEDGFGPEEAQRQLARRVWGRRIALARSDVVVPSLTLQDIAIHTWKLKPQRVHYVPNGIAPRNTYATWLDEVAPGLPPGLPRIAWAGGLRAEKNLLRLLQAFAPIKDQAVLLLIGDGPDRAAVLKEAERLELGASLRLLGPRTDVRDLLMQCQVLALSSDTEQMPIVVLEAMDAGLPVASCDVGDVRHMVAPENRAFVAPPAQLSAALQTLVSDPALRAAVGEANRARLRRIFCETKMVDAYRALFLRRLGRAACSS